MKIDNVIPVLVKAQTEIDFGNRSFYDPEIRKCDNCGSNLFYIGNVYGLKRKLNCFLSNIKVVGETKESKYFRKFKIEFVSEERFCAVCGMSNGLISVWEDKNIVKEFDDMYDKEYYEKALDLLQYPKSATQSELIAKENAINEIKKWIKEWEEKNSGENQK